MKKILITIKDKNQDNYMEPMPANTIEEAIDFFMELIDTPEFLMKSEKKDMELWEIGIWDNEKGKIESTEKISILTGEQTEKEYKNWKEKKGEKEK